MTLWTLLAALLISVGCSADSIVPQTESQACANINTRYGAIAITDTLTDTILVVVPAYLVWQLQMSVKLKLQVIAVFAFRIPLLPLSILAFTNFKESLRSSNPGVDRTPVILFQQAELCFSLIAATIPCLKSFIRSFDTSSGTRVNYTSHGYSSTSYGKSYKMQSMSGHRSRNDNHENGDGTIKINKRPFTRDNQQHESLGGAASSSKVTSVAFCSDRPRDADADDGNRGSQEWIIRRDVQWEVRSEHAR